MSGVILTVPSGGKANKKQSPQKAPQLVFEVGKKKKDKDLIRANNNDNNRTMQRNISPKERNLKHAFSEHQAWTLRFVFFVIFHYYWWVLYHVSFIF